MGFLEPGPATTESSLRRLVLLLVVSVAPCNIDKNGRVPPVEESCKGSFCRRTEEPLYSPN